MFIERLNTNDNVFATLDHLKAPQDKTAGLKGACNLRGQNTASVPHYSPFRYPGGKSWLSGIFRQWLAGSGSSVLYEPFAGGGSMSLLAVIENFIPRAVLFEKDAAVAAVWKTILSSDAHWLIDRILKFRISIDSVNDVLMTKTRTTRTLAFQTIVKNRCRRGGVIAGGAGLIVRGERGNGIKSRWYPETLAKRIQLIYEHRERLEIREDDAFRYLPKLLKSKSSRLFLDPPYTKLMTPGVKPLYLHCRLNHERLCEMLARSEADYLLTYDDTSFTRQLLEDCGLPFYPVDMMNSNAVMKRELLVSNDFTKVTSHR
ncbi:MAG: DNA adenine methylase [Betaproteobacteria bacterium]|nr:DNA adenine methylase [Betaproteobacteria bacterium]